MAGNTVASVLSTGENSAKFSSPSTHSSCFQQTWKQTSLFLCVFVVALSAGVPYLLARLPPLFLQRGLIEVDHYFSNWGRHVSPSLTTPTFQHFLLWMAPFFSGGGYCSEAISYVTALEESGSFSKLVIRHHGDAESLPFWKGLGVKVRHTLSSLSSVDLDVSDAVVVCHSEPGAWHPPLYMTPPCPPNGYEEPLYVVGRTMFETDGVTAQHVRRCNRMDEVWVPTQFHVETFTRAGVVPEKLVKVVQPVDTRFFNPVNRMQPFRLPTTNPLFGSTTKPGSPPPFVFLSIFKWEYRKGWDVLLSAYLSTFSATDNVSLYLLTKPYHSHSDFATAITTFVSSSHHSIPSSPSGSFPSVYLLDHHIPQSQLPFLYQAADCFVLPSRGEGWGRPHVEAMAMELPVIATNWSGMTEYMTEGNSYPLRVERLVEVEEGPFQGQRWAEPSGEHLRELMRHVVGCGEEAKGKGKRARRDVVEKYALEVVARLVEEQLVRIQGKIEAKRSATTERYNRL